MTAGPRPLHPEVTADRAAVRWVTHHRRLAGAEPGTRSIPAPSPLAPLVADGSVVAVAVAAGGDVVVRAASPDRWPALAPRVRAALAAELDAIDALAGDDAGHWLLAAPVPSPDDLAGTPSVAEVQATIDRLAGSVLAAHGGEVTVTEVVGTTVRVRPGRACEGCGQLGATVVDLVGPAIRAAHTRITDVVVDRRNQAPG